MIYNLKIIESNIAIDLVYFDMESINFNNSLSYQSLGHAQFIVNYCNIYRIRIKVDHVILLIHEKRGVMKVYDIVNLCL